VDLMDGARPSPLGTPAASGARRTVATMEPVLVTLMVLILLLAGLIGLYLLRKAINSQQDR
jgi:hypothetical protein